MIGSWIEFGRGIPKNIHAFLSQGKLLRGWRDGGMEWRDGWIELVPWIVNLDGPRYAPSTLVPCLGRYPL